MARSTEERVAGLEARMDNVEGDVKEIKSDVKAVHSRINDLIENEIAHVKRDILNDRRFWAAVLGAGGAFTLIIEVFIRLAFPV